MKAKQLVALGAFLLLAGVVAYFSYRPESYRRSLIRYQVPDVTLLNQAAQPVPLRAYLNADRPVILEFIFTSCTTLCPNLAIKFANFQQRLGAESDQVRLVSISIDPQTDTPAVLRAYLARYQAKPGWDFLTGSVEDIKQVMAAFQISPTDMITLDAAILLRSAKSDQWVRIDGQLSSEDFLREYRLLR